MRKVTLSFLLMMALGMLAQDVDMSLAKHHFFYAGQSKRMRMFIVKDGHVSWAFEDKQRQGEISDAVLMTDGHILMAHQYGIAEVTQDGQTVWQYGAPEGTEIHTIQPIGQTHVVFVQNGKPAKGVVMEIPSKRIVREFELPISEKGSVHGQFRNARLTSRGTLLICLIIIDYIIKIKIISLFKIFIIFMFIIFIIFFALFIFILTLIIIIITITTFIIFFIFIIIIFFFITILFFIIFIII